MIRSVLISLLLLISVIAGFAQPSTLADVNLAQQYYNNREFAKAAVVYRELYKINPSKAYYYYYLNCLWELQEFDDARELIEKSIKSNKTDISFEVDLGYNYIRMGKKDKGDKIYQDALKSLKADQNQIRNLANAFNTRGEYALGAECYLKGRELFGNNKLFRSELGNSYAMTRNFNGMIEEYLLELDENPTSVAFTKNRFQALLRSDVQENIYDLLRKALIIKIQANPGNMAMNDLLIWLYTQKNDFQSAFIQAKALDVRLQESGERIFLLAESAISNGDTEAALLMYNYLVAKGPRNSFYLPARIASLNIRYTTVTRQAEFNPADVQSLHDTIEVTIREMKAGDEQANLSIALSHLKAFYLNEVDTAIQILEEQLKRRDLRSETIAKGKLELADIQLYRKDRWEAALLYAQVEKENENNVLGHEAKYRKAKLAYYSGDFRWAEAQLNVLKASTSKLIANDAMYLAQLISNNSTEDSLNRGLQLYAEADLFLYKKMYAEAFANYDSVLQLFPAHPILDDVYLQKGKALEALGKYGEAITCYDMILTRYKSDGLGDDALFNKARVTEEKIGDKSAAMSLYSDLLIDYPGSIYAVEARKRFRKLRGDQEA